MAAWNRISPVMVREDVDFSPPAFWAGKKKSVALQYSPQVSWVAWWRPFGQKLPRSMEVYGMIDLRTMGEALPLGRTGELPVAVRYTVRYDRGDVARASP